jgi:putative membrane protein
LEGDVFNSLINTAMFAGTAAAMTCLFLFLYTRITPYKEFVLIREGNTAAAYALAGALVGFVLPLYAVITNTHSLVDMVGWSGIGFAIQLVIYVGVSFAMDGMQQQVKQGNDAAGIFLGACSLAGGIVTAACLVP